MKTNRVYSIYSEMEHKGVFSHNPANMNSFDKETGQSLYDGPVQFPMMLYHPQGKTEIITPEIKIAGRNGPEIETPEQRSLISLTVTDATEYNRAREEGWHEHPADAIAASGKTPPLKGATDTVNRLENEIDRLKGLLKDQQKKETLKSPATATGAKP